MPSSNRWPIKGERYTDDLRPGRKIAISGPGITWWGGRRHDCIVYEVLVAPDQPQTEGRRFALKVETLLERYTTTSRWT